MNEWPWIRARRVFAGGGVAAIVGLGALAIGALFDPDRAAIAYVFAYSTIAAIAIGALIWMLIAHAANARWPAPMLRVHESSVSRRLGKITKQLRKQIVHNLQRSGMSRRQAEEALEGDVRDLAVDVRARLGAEREQKATGH